MFTSKFIGHVQCWICLTLWNMLKQRNTINVDSGTAVSWTRHAYDKLLTFPIAFLYYMHRNVFHLFYSSSIFLCLLFFYLYGIPFPVGSVL